MSRSEEGLKSGPGPAGRRPRVVRLLAAGLVPAAVCFLASFLFLPAGAVTPAGRTAAPNKGLRPVRDDVGFCWDRSAMRQLVRYLESVETERFPAEGLVAAISPHDDYLYAGRVYYPLFRVLRAKEAVVFGVTHGTVRSEIKGLDSVLILDDFKLWPGVLGPVGVSGLREYIEERLPAADFTVNDRAHELEHSIEALIPFLQYFNPDVRITPIMVAPMPLGKMEELSDRLAGVIAAYIREKKLTPGKDIFFLVSSDGNHYGQDFNNLAFGEGESAWAKALDFDRRLIRSYLTGVVSREKVAGLTRELWGETYLDYRSSYWCGKYSIPFGLLAAEKTVKAVTGKDLSGRLFRFSDTYSEGVLPLKKTGMGTTAPFSLRHWVSFCSIGYYLY